MNIYTLPRTPGATDTTEWTAFCHNTEPFIVIDHDRWRADYSAERKRKFKVTRYRRRLNSRFTSLLGTERWFATLAKAQAFAAKQAATD